MRHIFLNNIIILLFMADNAESSWWMEKFNTCVDKQQSPIAIESNNVRYNSYLTVFELIHYETIPRNAHWELFNTGHSLKINIQGDYTATYGNLPGEYQPVYVDLHWASTDTNGSEHIIDGQGYAAEFQLIHYNTRYDSFDEAVKHNDGLAGFAFLFNVSRRDNPIYTQIVNSLTNVTLTGQKVMLRPVPLLSLFPINLNNYYRYEGSLTWPPCHPTLIWTVFPEEIPLSTQQLDRLRAVLGKLDVVNRDLSTGVTSNCRHVQPLGDRTVYSSDIKHATFLTAPLSPVSITLAVFLGFLLMFCILGRPEPENEHPLDHNEFHGNYYDYNDHND